MQFDILNDALTTIRNASAVGKSECTIKASKLIGNVLKIMQEYEYIDPFEYVNDGRGGKFKIKLNGSINYCGIIKPRVAIKKTTFEKYESRYLAGQDFGVIILSTNKGVISHYHAKKEGIGGRLLAYVY